VTSLCPSRANPRFHDGWVMRALSTAELIAAWEVGVGQCAARRVLTLLEAACDEATTPEQITQLSIGQCDERLLWLREQIFGPRLNALSACPECRETVEFGINAADIRVSPISDSIEAIHLEHQDYDVRFRLPNCSDIASLDASADDKINRERLLERCVLNVQHKGADVSAERLPAEVVSAISERMAQADPQVDVQLALACPQCGHQWNSPLDIMSFFWSELHAWALRLLHEIHLLASAYGWRQTDILSMSATRRHAYLEMINR
jgi:hypothetical protein